VASAVTPMTCSVAGFTLSYVRPPPAATSFPSINMRDSSMLMHHPLPEPSRNLTPASGYRWVRERLAAVLVDRRERGDARARQASRDPVGTAERDHSRDRHLVRHTEELFHIGLATDHHRRDDASDAFFTRREEDAPHERVDRGAADHRVAIKISIDG